MPHFNPRINFINSQKKKERKKEKKKERKKHQESSVFSLFSYVGLIFIFY